MPIERQVRPSLETDDPEDVKKVIRSVPFQPFEVSDLSPYMEEWISNLVEPGINPGGKPIIEVRIDFEGCLGSIKLTPTATDEGLISDTPLGEAKYVQVTKDRETVVTETPLTLSVEFYPKSEEQFNALFESRLDFKLGDRTYRMNCLPNGIDSWLEIDGERLDLSNSELEAVNGTSPGVVLPFNVNCLTTIRAEVIREDFPDLHEYAAVVDPTEEELEMAEREDWQL